jgi:hypothetical protein
MCCGRILWQDLVHSLAVTCLPLCGLTARGTLAGPPDARAASSHLVGAMKTFMMPYGGHTEPQGNSGKSALLAGMIAREANRSVTGRTGAARPVADRAVLRRVAWRSEKLWKHLRRTPGPRPVLTAESHHGARLTVPVAMLLRRPDSRVPGTALRIGRQADRPQWRIPPVQRPLLRRDRAALPARWPGGPPRGGPRGHREDQ